VKAFKGLREKVYKGEGGFTLIELLIVIIILGILAAVVAFNVAGFLGAGTEESAKTERASVQTALIGGMADESIGAVTAGNIINTDTTKTVVGSGGNFTLETYIHLPTQGNWQWDTAGVVTAGAYEGGGTCCAYANGTWLCTDGASCGTGFTCS
jgi:prepilin-type N-terminal cleavage/methylation domain-containing protein